MTKNMLNLIRKRSDDIEIERTYKVKVSVCIKGDFVYLDSKQCSICEGFYGNECNMTVCSTCHLFLFPSDINSADESLLEKTDSGDSGTEEPRQEEDFYLKGENISVATYHSFNISRQEKLSERINELSVYRKEEKSDYSFDELPTEVLLSIFLKLDDIALYTARKVCTRWRLILDNEISEDSWQQYVTKRWPLFSSYFPLQKSWRKTYTLLLESSSCRMCLEDMMAARNFQMEEASWRQKRLMSEIKTFKSDPPEGIQAVPLDEHFNCWQACITGPSGSPYEGGCFYLLLQIPQSYPLRPPMVRFITKIFHPNVSRHGDIGLDSLHHNWSLALTISKVLISIQSLLTDPYTYVCMEPGISHLLEEQPLEFQRIARMWTWKFGMIDFVDPTQLNFS